MKWQSFGNIFLVVHSHQAPHTEEWRAFIAAGRNLRAVIRRCLVLSGEVVLDARQRQDVRDLAIEANVRQIAVVADSQATRALVTGLAWFTGVHKAFASSELSEACRYLEFDDDERVDVLGAAANSARLLGNSEQSEVIQQALGG